MKPIRTVWRKLTEPSARVVAPEQRRRIHLLLTVLVVIWLLWLLVIIEIPLELLTQVSPARRYDLTRVYPPALVILVVPLVGSYLLGRVGRYGFAARVLVAMSLASGFVLIFTVRSALSVDLPLVSIVLSSVLLTTADTIGFYVLSITGYFLLPMLVNGISFSDLSSAMITATAVGALSTASVIIRNRDLATIERQADELRHNQEELAAAHKMESVARLSAGLAHEFNNIMAAIATSAEIIRLHPNESSRVHADRILKASDRAEHLTDGLLSFGQQQLMSPERANVDDILRDRQKELQSHLHESTRLFLKASQDVKIVRVDVRLFHDAISTFVRKAEENLEGAGVVSIETRLTDLVSGNEALLPPGSYCILTIRDSGLPRDRGDRSRLFDPFFTTGEFGSGDLDLAAAYGFVRQSGGQLGFRSSPTEGNCIIVYVPCL